MTEAEKVFDMRSTRAMHVVDASRWLGSGNAYWLEWDHPGETPRPFSQIIESLEWVRWRQLIKPGSTCIDIGTHSGDTSIPMGLFSYDARNGSKGCVIGVEPNPDVHALLEASFALNSHIADFRVEKCAVTSIDLDEIELSDHGNSNCNGGIIGDYSSELRVRLEKSSGTKYKVKGKSLETIIKEYSRGDSPDNIQFIKTDCEGYDKEIIRSSRAVLDSIRPVLFVEWFAWFTPEDDDDLFAAISEVGYVPLHPGTLEPISKEDRVSDITCVHRDRLGEI